MTPTNTSSSIINKQEQEQRHNATTINTSTSNTNTNNNNNNRFDNLINKKYRATGLTTVADFLTSKARKSKRTVLTFSFVIDYLNEFIYQNYNSTYNIQTILSPIKKGEIDVYKLLNDFVNYLQNNTQNGSNLSPATFNLYISAAKSYFQFNDIDINPGRFKYRVALPSVHREDEKAIDANDIQNILNHCNNRRLKAFILVLASGGMRASEALAIREIDVDFSGINFADPNDTENPAVVRIRKEYNKTRTGRTIFISNEAARYLHDWVEWKYRDRTKERKYYELKNRVRSENDLIFSTVNATDPYGIYFKMSQEFQRVLEVAGLASRKEDGVYKRRRITFHSFRRFVKTTIANQTRNSDYSEWFLGHKKSPYYTNKPDELRRIYKEDCMKYLTFLDYPTVESLDSSYASKLKEKDKQIDALNQRIANLGTELEYIRDQWMANDHMQSTQHVDELREIKQQIIKLQKENTELREIYYNNNKTKQ